MQPSVDIVHPTQCFQGFVRQCLKGKNPNDDLVALFAPYYLILKIIGNGKLQTQRQKGKAITSINRQIKTTSSLNKGIKILKVGINDSFMMDSEQDERKSLDSFTLDYIYNKIIELELKNIENKNIGYEYKDRAYSEIIRIVSDSKRDNRTIDNRTIQKLKRRRTDLS